MSLFRGTAETALYCAHSFNSPYILKGSLVDPRLRASNEGLLRPRVARAQEPRQATLPSHPSHFPHHTLGVPPDGPSLRASTEHLQSA